MSRAFAWPTQSCMTDISAPIVWVTGSTGQVGRAIMATAPATVRCVPLARPEFDLSTPDWVEALARRAPPNLILHAGAWTAVDRAESEPELAMATNVGGTTALAACAAACGARMILVSTDYVFSGDSSTPWKPDAAAAPRSVYGTSKWLAEQSMAALDPARACIVRTSWVYDAHGQNFVRTMLRLMSSLPQVRIVSDQFGTPTAAGSLAACLWQAARMETEGILHFADAGTASWYDFAVAIQDIALELRLLSHRCELVPIATRDYPTPAQRPAFSVLDRSRAWSELQLPAVHWRHALAGVLQQLAVNRSDS